MATTVAFDVYGTLIDTQSVTAALAAHLGDRAGAFSDAWRDKQLEYSFRRAAMQDYVTFAVCTREALDFTCARFGVDLSAADRAALLDAYRVLPAFADVEAGLARAAARGLRLHAFSNGSADAVETLLTTAGIRDHFIDVVSCDEVQSFKPNPAVYHHFLARAATSGDRAWLVSSNPFDVLGAMNAGLRAVWVRRLPDAVFDPWGREPTATVASLTELADILSPDPAKGRS